MVSANLRPALFRSAALLLSLLLHSCAPAAPEPPRTLVNPVFDAYIDLQTALAADSADTARLAAARLAEQATGSIGGLAELIAVSADIEQQRSVFVKLSEVMIEEGTLPEGYMQVHCPMVDEDGGADWLQRAGPIRNPYFGSDMLSCGAPVPAGH